MARNNRNKLGVAVMAVAAFACMAASANAELLVYEGFQYGAVGEELHNQPDGLNGDIAAIGLDPATPWVDASPTSNTVNDMYLKSGNLIFSNLAASGNHIGFLSNLNNDRYYRPLTADAQTAIDDVGSANGTIYFSFLFEKLQNNNGADEEGFVLGNKVVANSRMPVNDGTDGLIGFGIAPSSSSGSNLVAYAWDGSGTVIGTQSLATPAANGGSNTNGSNLGDVKFIVGEISFNTGDADKDVFKFYNVTDDGSIDAGDLVLIDTIEIDADETALSTLNLTRQVNVNYDEIRIGTSLDEVLGVIPEPGSAMLLLSGLLGMALCVRRKR